MTHHEAWTTLSDREKRLIPHVSRYGLTTVAVAQRWLWPELSPEAVRKLITRLAEKEWLNRHLLAGQEPYFVLGAKAGLNLDKLHEALTGGAANSWAFQNLGKKILNRDFAPAFKVKLQQKDLRLVSEAARELHVPIMAAELVQQLLKALEAQGAGEQGTQSLVTVLEKLAGTTVSGHSRA